VGGGAGAGAVLAAAAAPGVNATFDSARTCGFVALFYFALCYPIALAATALERRLARGMR